MRQDGMDKVIKMCRRVLLNMGVTTRGVEIVVVN